MEIRSSNSNSTNKSSTISPLHPLRKSTFRFGNRNSSSNPNPTICTEEEEELRRLPLLGRMRSAIKRCSKISNHKISSSSQRSRSRQIATSQTTAVVCIRPRPVGATTYIRHRYSSSSSNSHHHKLVPPPVALSPSDKPP